MANLKDIANNLDLVLKKYAHQDSEAKNLSDSLRDLIDRALEGDDISTEEKVPGYYWFSEGGLSQYKDLESAYSHFSIFIAAGSSDEYEKILKKVDDI